MNKVILVGRTTKDIELREVKAKGKETMLVANFTLAVDDKKADETSFISCVAWNKLAETLEAYVKKGSPIQLWGRIKTRDYEDKDGNKRYSTDVVVEGFEFCPANIPPEKEEKKGRSYGRK